MNRMTRKIISLALVLMLALSLLPASVFAAADSTVPVKSASVATKAAGSNMQDAVTLHCWNWSYANIEANLDKIAAAGYTAIQTSPIQPIKESTNESWSLVKNQWWVYYQPTEFKINTATNNALGTKTQFASMCAAAEAKGIKVIVDVVANHLADNGGNNVSTAVPSYLRNNSAYWHDISKNTNDWNNRYEVTQFCMAGLPDLNTGNKEIQNYVLTFLKECVDAGADGFRFDAAKHIEVPEDSYCASDFWPTVINGIKSYKSDVYIYGEMLDDTGGTAFSNYTEYMSITDNRWSDKVRENVINSGNAGNFYYSYDNGVSADKLVLWAESHDTYGNEGGASMYDSTQNINKTWALIAARADAMSLYLARPSSLSQKLGVASTNTGWDWEEVAAVNKFHTHFAGQTEYVSNSNGYAMVERGTTGAVIVNVGSDGNVNIPVNAMANGTYVDQISGNTFTVSNGRISGKISHQCGYAVVYNACSHTWKAGATTAATCTTDGATNYTCTKCGTTKSEVIPAKGHSYTNDKCTVCGAVKPADHILYFSNSGKWSTINVYYWSDSDTTMTTWPGKAMTSVGNNVYTYTVPADATYVIFNNGQDGDSNKTADLTIPATNNYYKDGSWTTYATCTHSYTSKVTTAATCTTAGVKTFTCSKCSHSYTETIAAAGHKYVSGVCTNCGVKEPCTSHSWNSGSVTTAATCDKAGVKTYTCSNCGNTKTETIDALGHKFVNGTCSVCGASEKSDTMTIYFQNNWMWSEIKLYYWGSTTGENPEWPGIDMEFYAEDTNYDIYALEIPSDVTGIVISGIKDDGSGYRDQTPDITSGMYDGICYYMKWDSVNSKNAIGYEDIDVMIPPVECKHNYTAEVTAPTCTTGGYTTYTCSACGDSYVADEVAALDHSWTDATCTAPKTCTLCGATEGETLGHAAVTYSFVNNTHTFTCTVCGEVAFTQAAASSAERFGLKGASPVLSDDIVMVYETFIPAGFENAYMVFQFNGETTVVTESEYVAATGRTCFRFPGLNPQKMGDNIHATLYATVDGYEVSIVNASYSMVQYCDRQLKNSAISAELRTALSDLLIYGEMNQIYEGYKTDALCTSLLSAEATLTPSTFPAAGVDASWNVQSMTGTKLDDCTFTGVGVTLGAKIVIGLNVTCTDTERFSFKVTIGGVDHVITGDMLVPTGVENKYVLNFDKITAIQLGQTITFTIWEGDTQVSRTATYSVYSYIYKNQNTADTNMANLLKAIYNYGEAVKAL